MVPIVRIALGGLGAGEPASPGPVRNFAASAGRSPIRRTDELVVVVLGIESPGHGKLFVVIHANDALPLGFRLGEGGEEHSGENRDDGDDDQEFDEGESGTRAQYWITHKDWL